MHLVAAISMVLTLSAGLSPAQTPASDQTRREAYQHYQQGWALLSAEQFEKAAEEFRSAIKLDGLFTDAHYGLGKAFMGLQRYASAVQAYEGCLAAAEQLHALRNSDRVAHDRRIDEEVRAMREALVAVRRQKTGGVENQVLQLESRLRDLERSRSSLGDAYTPPAEVLLALGSAHFRNGNGAEARRNWEMAVMANPELGEAWNNLAVVYMREHRKGDAEQAVKNAEAAGFRVNPRLKEDIAGMKN